MNVHSQFPEAPQGLAAVRRSREIDRELAGRDRLPRVSSPDLPTELPAEYLADEGPKAAEGMAGDPDRARWRGARSGGGSGSGGGDDDGDGAGQVMWRPSAHADRRGFM